MYINLNQRIQVILVCVVVSNGYHFILFWYFQTVAKIRIRFNYYYNVLINISSVDLPEVLKIDNKEYFLKYCDLLIETTYCTFPIAKYYSDFPIAK